MRRKGQINIGDAPGVVLIALFLFMVMGTSAYVLERYQDSFDADLTGAVYNETLTTVDEFGEQVAGTSACNFESFVLGLVTNETSGIILLSGNYTSSSGGMVYSAGDLEYNNTNWNVSYTYLYSGTACDVTEDLTLEVEDNVSIAGMVLTIALIGIVLSILIGLFYVFTSKRGL